AAIEGVDAGLEGIRSLFGGEAMGDDSAHTPDGSSVAVVASSAVVPNTRCGHSIVPTIGNRPGEDEPQIWREIDRDPDFADLARHDQGPGVVVGGVDEFDTRFVMKRVLEEPMYSGQTVEVAEVG